MQEFTHVPQQAAYRQLLDYMLLPGGWLILATLAPGVVSRGKSRYTAAQLAALLGEGYQLHGLVQAPYGRLDEPVQPYTYALFQRGLHPRHGFRSAHLG